MKKHLFYCTIFIQQCSDVWQVHDCVLWFSSAPNLTKLGIYVTPAENVHNVLLSSISTTRWHYNQGKCILVYNSHILCRTFKNLISMPSLNWVESRDIGNAHFCLFFFANLEYVINILFPAPLKRFHQFAQNFAHSICGLA